jgi:hypothetical protein
MKLIKITVIFFMLGFCSFAQKANPNKNIKKKQNISVDCSNYVKDKSFIYSNDNYNVKLNFSSYGMDGLYFLEPKQRNQYGVSNDVMCQFNYSKTSNNTIKLVISCKGESDQEDELKINPNTGTLTSLYMSQNGKKMVYYNK